MKEVELQRNLERMQLQLYLLVEQTGSFVDPKVVKLSQEIDQLVVCLQRMRMKDKLRY
ncbi:aspartyl-phosphate phosphatase Spo0E family protein [Paenibacillus cremeus]|uniref:Spo0E family sporulation regulatory protein-aspartic acid phosphatase n=1 Tax=Paenibacillus cremeus TaxID=2163881 RepID=A0A559KD41_9BACL|nr:aspartyl-phosphate phosphatase Spo0E family protein [Paenibacillus cremeus]TVY10023.1 Spo0E family sporulation regulatory protein-aspartic acid phosphatase [Paenibacillus cremeus]